MSPVKIRRFTATPVWIGASFDGKKAIMNDSAEQRISLVENLP